jgi:hypothetical protein
MDPSSCSGSLDASLDEVEFFFAAGSDGRNGTSMYHTSMQEAARPERIVGR